MSKNKKCDAKLSREKKKRIDSKAWRLMTMHAKKENKMLALPLRLKCQK
jgi:hypothetical protein